MIFWVFGVDEEMESLSEMVSDLRMLPCLSGLQEDELAFIGGMSRVRHIPVNSILFLESEPVESFFIIRQGSVKLYKSSPEGRELIMRIMKAGDYFCCAPVYESKTHYVSAVALEDSVLLVIPADEFRRQLLGGISAIGMRMIGSLCSRIRYLSGLVEDLTFKDVEHRVLIALLKLAEEKISTDNIVSLSFTHQNIASMTGTVREVVSRVMLKLKKEKIIVESSIRGFKIDKARLTKYLDRK